MIPTSVSSLPTSPMTGAVPCGGVVSNSPVASNSPLTTAGNGSGVGSGVGGVGSGNGMTTTAGGTCSQQQQQNYSTVLTGIAALILEGRAVVDAAPASAPSPPRPAADAVSNFLSGIRSEHMGGGGGGGSGGGGGLGGRQSPRPSTSRAAFLSAAAAAFGTPAGSGGGGGSPTSYHQPVINITTNPNAYQFGGEGFGGVGGGMAHPRLVDAYSSSASSSLASSAESTHQRWTQKLCQLRQASPMSLDQRLTLEAHSSGGGEAEVLVLASPRPVSGGGGGGGGGMGLGMAGSPGSASSSLGSGSGSENFLHSLQSLATTCLRGGGAGSPSLDSGCDYQTSYIMGHHGGGGGGGGFGGGGVVGVGVPTALPKYHQQRSFRAPTPRFQNPAAIASSPYAVGGQFDGYTPTTTTSSGSNNSNNRGDLFQTFRSATQHLSTLAALSPPGPARLLRERHIMLPPPSSPSPHTQLSLAATTTPTVANCAAPAATITPLLPYATATPLASPPPPQPPPPTTAATGSPWAATTTTTTKGPAAQQLQQGPHCDKFLRKMGLAKGEAAEAEEHFCDMSYVNITCSRWRAYCLRMEAIMARGEPICIEVYLGPMGHKVLLEQWIITQREKVPPPTMTLPSLCSAIRSQLYFSQVSAWCDLVRRSDAVLLLDSGRVIFPKATGAAGDLATPAHSNSGSSSSVGSLSGNQNNNNGSNNNNGNSSGSNNNNNGSNNDSGSGSNNGSAGVSLAGGGLGGNGSSPSSANGSFNGSPRPASEQAPRLNIFYRIKAHDSTACFNSKPNTHNFPNVNLSENCSISVCLKSLPRIGGGIPRVAIATTATTAPSGNTATTTTNNTPRSGDGSNNSRIASRNAQASRSAQAIRSLALAQDDQAVVTPARPSPPPPQQQQPTSTAMTAPRSSGRGMEVQGEGSVRNGVGQNARNARLATLTETPRSSRPAVEQNRPQLSAAPLNCDRQQQQHAVIFGEAMASPIGMTMPTAAMPSSLDRVGGERRDSGIGSSGGSSHGGGGGGGGKYRCKFFIDEEELLLESTFAGSTQKRHSQQAGERLHGEGGVFDDDDGGCGIEDETVADAQVGVDVTDRAAAAAETTFDDECCDDECYDDDDYDDNASDVTANGHGLDAGGGGGGLAATAHLSHREKQLLKYRKRMQRRDKKRDRKPLSGVSDGGARTAWLTTAASGVSSPATAIPAPEPMEEGGTSVTPPPPRMISTGTQTPSLFGSSCCPQCGGEKKLVCLNCRCNGAEGGNSGGGVCAAADSSATEPDEMDDDDCAAGGGGQGFDDSSSACSLSGSGSDIIRTPRNKAELLLQAIQRTPKTAKKLRKQAMYGNRSAAAAAAALQNNNQAGSAASSGVGGGPPIEPSCQVCKRQKTQHNFAVSPRSANAEEEDKHTLLADNEKDQGVLEVDTGSCNGGHASERRLLEEAVCGEKNEDETTADQKTANLATPPRPRGATEETYVSSTKLTPNFDRCSLRSSGPATPASTATATKLNGTPFKAPAAAVGPQPPRLLQLTSNYRNGGAATHSNGYDRSPLAAAPSIPSPTLNNTANTTHCHQQQQQQPLLARKGLPKVNLTPLFCGPQQALASSTCSPLATSSAPIPINCPGYAESSSFYFEAGSALPPPTTPLTPTSAGGGGGGIGGASTHPVQKSYSAPTLPNAPSPSSLSPRFAKQAAVYKRRSRHLSDRSDRSSLGSDEQFSDEELDYGSGGLGGSSGGLYSPAVSPLKGGAAALRSGGLHRFGRLPLLGNLEEALLQRRLVPKTEVLGFKVLLGASGGFCPTQLTIPAVAHFYELHGATLSTPYVCEIRLPRKGYSVPRLGTVQATLLNPMGTVVRVFVIPYDLRDMPPLHQTFIRQRVLAEAAADGGGGGGGEANSVAQTPAAYGDQKIAGHTHTHNNNNNEGEPYFGKDLSGEAGDCAMSGPPNSAFFNGNAKNNNNNNNNNHLGYGKSNGCGVGVGIGDSNQGPGPAGHLISTEHMKRLRYSIHLRFQTSRSGRLSLHTNIRLLISRRTDCDTAAAHAKGALEAPNDLVTDTIAPTGPKYSARQESSSRI